MRTPFSFLFTGLILWGANVVAVPVVVAASAEAADEKAVAAPADSALGLRADEELTELESLTVEAENRVRIRFARPTLRVDVDPSTAPGLDWGSIVDVLDRHEPDLVAPLLASSSGERSPYLARPWLDGFRDGPVARFRPSLDGVARWSMTIADSRGNVVRTFGDSGSPPDEIAWDGRTDDGDFAAVGLVYSYVLEAQDRAGNKRNFVGDAFELVPYRTGGEDDAAPRFLLTARQLEDGAPVPALLLEASTRINRIEEVERAVEVRVSARSREQAEATAQRVVDWLTPLVIDGSRRILAVTEVAPDAPEAVGLEIALRP